MAKVAWTAEAQRWLREIYDYIETDNPDAAYRVVDGLFEKARLLEQFPQLGYRYERHPDREVRILLYGHYRIAYLVKSDGDIDVLGVFHGALDLERYQL